MSTTLEAYFAEKKTHERKEVSDVSGQVFEALGIATSVLRLHFPMREVRGVHCYFNNSPIEPFLRAEHPSLHDSPREHERKLAEPCQQYVVVDIYFLFGGAYPSKNEDNAFVVEVVFPSNVHLKRVRWQNIIRVRWADLGWKQLGNSENDFPVPKLSGETFVNDWS